MPVIVFASSKGGAGKTTSALVLATELEAIGAAVTLIDTDTNKPLSRWSTRPNKPGGITVISDISEETIIQTIEAAAQTTSFVIVDLEGTASMMVAFAVSRADLARAGVEAVIPAKSNRRTPRHSLLRPVHTGWRCGDHS